MKNVRSSFLHNYPCPITTVYKRLENVAKRYAFDYSLHRYPFIIEIDLILFKGEML
jgi:hypothetical protein